MKEVKFKDRKILNALSIFLIFFVIFMVKYCQKVYNASKLDKEYAYEL